MIRLKNNNLSKIKAVIFDVDGVLVDSKHANFIYVRDTLKHFGHREIKEEEYIKLFHGTGEYVVRKLIPDITEEELEKLREYQSEVAQNYHKYARLNPGIKDILKFLKNKGILLGVVTNRTNSVFKILEFFEIRDYFEVVVGSHDVTNAKPHPEPVLKATKSLKIKPEHVMYIGDSDTDVESANAAGAVSVFYSEDENPDANFNIKNIDELKKIINL